ncbi:hypothetical protein HYV30_00410 [Candidatus Kaiserbacteria bacterium]|nr:hypothetical protein [Candidatus Kaiserbacteria bacterium]
MINTTYIDYYKNFFVGTINSVLVPVLIALAFIVFLYGAYKYFIYGAAVETERKTGRTVMLYGVIGFVLIFSLWGLVNMLMSTLNLGGQNAPPPPTVGGGRAAPTGGTAFPSYDSGWADDGGWGSAAPAGNSDYQNCLADGLSPAVCSAATSAGTGTGNICMNSSATNQGDPLPCVYGAPSTYTTNSVEQGGACTTNYQCKSGLYCTNGTCEVQAP